MHDIAEELRERLWKEAEPRGLLTQPHHNITKAAQMSFSVFNLASLGVHCSLRYIEQNFDSLDELWDFMRRSFYHTSDLPQGEVIEMLETWNAPGLQSVLRKSGMIDMGMENVLSHIGGAMLPAVLIPVQIFSFSALILEDPKKAPDLIRAVADKMREDADCFLSKMEKWLEEFSKATI